eukprot:TRINITY_DN8936_c0_g1_i1.p1 TRINITY_DN8936_c0_g1~~TRINITY_DN8936_c0_g1_i1.p1  ORF type:complete len:558 (-),score=77.98 TRINITY_DN8936_c0_g1_i1:72-1745(-)
MLQHDGDEMPRIYFFLSGRHVPLTAIGGSGSPVGTRWIMLDLLGKEHIQAILNKLPIEFEELRGCRGLAAALKEWTGGSPRLLLYSLRALYYLYPAGVHHCEHAMEEVYRKLKNINAISGEVFLAQEDEKDWKEAWLYLVLLSQLRVPCQRQMVLPVGSSGHPLEVLLGRLNLYIEPAGNLSEMEDAFYLCHMKMVDRFVREKYSSDCRVRLFLGKDHTGVVAASLLERLVEQRIIVQACLGPQGTWKELLQPLLNGTMVDDYAVVLDKGCPLQLFPKVTVATKSSMLTGPLPSTIHPDNLEDAMDKVSSNRIYRTAPQSASADTFIKQSDFTIEIQDKSGLAAGVSFNDICEEVEKCLKKGRVLWVLVAMRLKRPLQSWVGDKPLLLKPGMYQQPAGNTARGLLYRPLHSDAWSEEIWNGERLEAPRNVQGRNKLLAVRDGLELVIAPPNVIKQFLGDQDFGIIKELAEKKLRGDQINIPFLSRFYNFATDTPTQAVANIGPRRRDSFALAVLIDSWIWEWLSLYRTLLSDVICRTNPPPSTKIPCISHIGVANGF